MGNFLLSSGRAMATGIGQMAANAWARLGTFATQAGSFVANGLSAVGRAVAQTAESLWSRVTSWFDARRRRWENCPARPRGLAPVSAAAQR